MSSPGQSSGTNSAAEHFTDLWRQLGECYHNAVQELEAKVRKLKKERCLDAQRLEVFYSRNQQLKEQNKSLQDTISLLEKRLRAGECERCAMLEETVKNKENQNLCLIAKLKNKTVNLEDENGKLQAELQKLKLCRSDPLRASSLEQEEGVIPDSPILPSSLPVANKLKKRKNSDKSKHIRYAELQFPQCNNSLFSEVNKEPIDAPKNPGRAELLVPNTCELATSQKDVNHILEEAIAETCVLELLDNHCMKTEAIARKAEQNGLKYPWKNHVHSNLHPATEGSPSLLPRVKRFSEDSSINKAKRKKEKCEPEVQPDNKEEIQKGVENQKSDEHIQCQLMEQTSTTLSRQNFKKHPLDGEVQSAQNDTSNQNISQTPNVFFTSPAFKKPNRKCKVEVDGVRKKRTPAQDVNTSHGQPGVHDAERNQSVEPTWSIDPALALSTYDTEWREDEEKEEQCRGELADTDCTWVSHSLLQRQAQNEGDRTNCVSGLGEKANDSLDMMFETTAYGEYKSYNSPHLGQSQSCEEEEEEADQEDNKQDHLDNTSGRSKARHPTFAHIAVVRKKDERRKLKGTTCKECEIYYAHLPEEEKQKKLSACSRHRFLYIPPCTPENFWEVGFPSTQTCIERGYIKEDKNPQSRSRRRQPFNALFSPK